MSNNVRTKLNPMADRLHASIGVDGKTFIVLTDCVGDSFAIALPAGKTASQALSWIWKYGTVDLDKWSDAAALVPQYVHDCEKCRFLGRVRGDTGGADVWLDTHNSTREPVLIVRYSSEGSDYSAMEAWVYANAKGMRGQAYALAKSLGLLGRWS
jgi:hypothetical protein